VKVTICAIGRLKSGPERDLIEKYAKRIRWPLDIVEIEERRKLSPAELKTREGGLLSDALPDGSIRVALDERGASISSAKFADRMGQWRDQNRDIAFMIGGAGGLDKGLRDTADLVVSFGAATWPHMLARVMLVEQIYRAQEILAGNPYHRA
jgi:23S rRNA (pseudouridine1915-N3)-methyltransferase